MDEIQVLFRLLLSLPKRLDGVLDKMERGDVQVQAPGVEKHLASIEKNLKGLTGAVLFAALLIGGMQLLLTGYELPGYLLLGSGLLVLLLAPLSVGTLFQHSHSRRGS